MKKVLSISIILILLGILFPSPVAATVEGLDPKDPDLVYLEIRPHLDEIDVAINGVPTSVQIGIFKGFSLPIWNGSTNVNEELYFDIRIPNRYDEEHDIVVEVITALSDAGEKGNTYQLDLSWEKVTPDVEVVPVSFHSDSAQRYNLNNLQYYCYRDYFVIDYDAPIADPIIHEDLLALRIRLGQVGGQYPDLAGELIILHVGVLFPRGDLLGNPGDVITEGDMEAVATQFEAFNAILAGWSVYLLIVLGLIFILGLSFLAFWKYTSLLFMLVAGASIMFGLYLHNAFTTNLGLTIAWMLIGYSFVCIGYAFRLIFWREDTEG